MSIVTPESQERIPSLCDQFSRATGWPLAYTCADVDDTWLVDRLQNDPHCCWFAAIGDGTRVVGYLHLQQMTGEPLPPGPEIIGLAESLADLLARLAKATRRLESRNNDVSTLVNLGLAVPAPANLQGTLTQLLRAAVQLTGARSAAFFLLTPETTRLKLKSVYHIAGYQVPQQIRDLMHSPGDLTALSERPFLARNRNKTEQAWLPAGLRTGLCTAVESQTVPIGTLWVYDRRVRDFTDRDRYLVESIATQIAAVLERVALQQENETQDRIAREVRAASQNEPTLAQCDLPADPRYELAAHYASCYELGGDLCELLAISDDQVAIAIGDASGNSIPAAMIMSAVRGALRTHPGSEDQVALTVEKLNRALHSLTQSHQFMSLCYGVYDAAARRLTYCNAGHPVPLLIRAGRTIPLNSHGLLLGVVGETTYDTSVLDLQPDDLVVFYSDGISEARGQQPKLFGTAGIAAAVLNDTSGSAADILQRVWSDVETYVAGGEPADDRTLLVLKVH